ncbi:UDP-N-acetylmuramate dehydrogenase [Alicyclobacillus tolerans]|uniref:UDP-N-acetylmuramate dehydrogenase n=1 Tax=Alicyclobacillus tolerans TaxID=90970 RepID=UPI001F01C925|nr:UDP-N-acetylmuramate dehydrogenase [Alicyclobacillus tolerans]MCF8564476.1 UDP-N-acetylmuramate dehydrogenase [Alicyclobacillus tolerans]
MNSETVLSVFESNGVVHAKVNEPLARYTTWRIGGPADVYVSPRTVEELTGAVHAAKALGMPWWVMGKGSNLLVQDGGIRGLVIRLGDEMAKIEVDNHRVIAESGRSFVSAANIAIRHNLAGLEFATGIPGSVGGAVMMNAGAHGGEVKDVLEWADVLGGDGTIRRLTNRDLKFDYRYSLLKDHPGIVVRAAFLLQEGDGTALAEKVKQWSQRRSQTQPLSQPNCGSVFRNPPGTHAGLLIESAGLKGLRKGDAQISEKHANFIVNLGQAKAVDVLWLMRHAQETVRKKFGVELETEVRIVGEPA